MSSIEVFDPNSCIALVCVYESEENPPFLPEPEHRNTKAASDFLEILPWEDTDYSAKQIIHFR